MIERLKRVKVSFNSPVILGFTILCFLVLILGAISGGYTTNTLFSIYRSPLSDPLTYVRFFGHALGHVDLEHFIGNIMIILIVGPLLEEKYGSLSILLVILLTAFITGIINFILFPKVRLLGASSIAFALILLSSFTSIKDGKIPLTFILVSILYLGSQIYDGIFIRDNISNFSHILGGIVGSCLGYVLNKIKS